MFSGVEMVVIIVVIVIIKFLHRHSVVTILFHALAVLLPKKSPSKA